MAVSAQTKAFAIIDKGELEELKKVYEEADLKADFYDENGMTPLMQAAYKGNLDMCKFLLKNGAKVGASVHGNEYTALMMAALSGSSSVVQLLLDNGAKIETKNSIGRTAANLAAFTGQHDSLNILRNYLSAQKFEEYTVPQEGEDIARLPAELAEDVRGLVMQPNPHPVNLLIYLKDHPQMYEGDMLGRCQNVITDLCSKCRRSESDYDEILAIKLYYVSMVVNGLRMFLEVNKDGKINKLIKKMLRVDGDNVPVGIESFIRSTLKTFPFHDLPIYETIVETLSKTKFGEDPTALAVLIKTFNGVAANSFMLNECKTCGKNNSKFRCSVCKKSSYCSVACQKLHWSIHKPFCSK